MLFQKSWDYRKEKAGDDRPVRIAKWCVGRCLRSLGRLEDALELQGSLADDWEASDEEEVGYVSEELGECLHALGREEEARPHFARAFDLLYEKESWLKEDEPERLERVRVLGGVEQP